MLIVKAKIKELTGDFNVSADFADALNAEVERLVKKACERAKANSRKTVMGKDL
ncbi:MAG: DUF1931 domain-containing protein [Candidatus Nanoarchaeia archaeon]